MKKWLLAAALVVVGALLLTFVLVQKQSDSIPESGTDGYVTLANPVATGNPQKVEVLEYFWFGCPHCFAFEPYINQWNDKKPDHVSFVREAPPLNPSWLNHSKAFYAARVLGVVETLVEPMFNAIHQDDKSLRRLAEIADFAASLGIDRKKFVEAMGSVEVSQMIDSALEKANTSGINGVPAIVVNGKYLTGGSLAGGNRQVIEVIDQLVEIENR